MAEEKKHATRVTVTDLETGESETVEIIDDYVIICDGTCNITYVQTSARADVVTMRGMKRQ
jgi:hypothetical protein